MITIWNASLMPIQPVISVVQFGKILNCIWNDVTQLCASYEIATRLAPFVHTKKKKNQKLAASFKFSIKAVLLMCLKLLCGPGFEFHRLRLKPIVKVFYQIFLGSHSNGNKELEILLIIFFALLYSLSVCQHTKSKVIVNTISRRQQIDIVRLSSQL